MRRRTAATCVPICLALVAACGGGQTVGEPQSAPATLTKAAADTAYDFYDPCDETTSAWFAAHGYTHPQYIEPLLDGMGSECSYDDADKNGFALLSRPSTPGDETDQWVHEILGASGPVYDVTVGGHPTKMEVNKVARKRQDCHLVITVNYGFLEVTGGPLGHLAPSYPRDCDAVRDFASVLLGHMAETWDPDAGR